MRKMLFVLLGVLILSMLLAVRCNKKKDQDAGSSEAPPVNSVTAADVTMRWEVISSTSVLSVTLSAPTTGWIGVGFNTARSPVGSNVIIGYVQGGTAFVNDQHGPSSATLCTVDDTIRNVGGISGTEAAGVTELHFTIPLDSGDPEDLKLVAGGTYTAILSHGYDGQDDFTSGHPTHAYVTIKIQ